MGRGLGLSIKTGCGNHHRRDADVLCRDTRSGLLGRADAAAAVSRDDSVHAIFQQPLLEALHLRLAGPRTREQASRADFAQQVDRGIGKSLKDEPSQLHMGNTRHERASHKGNRFSVKALKTRSHLDHIDR